MCTVAETPAELTAIYKSATNISLVWTFTSNVQTNAIYTYVVYFENAGSHLKRYVTLFGGVNTYLLTGLPIGGVHSISIVAVRHLPSDVVGPVDPGIYIRYVVIIILTHSLYTAVVEPPEVTLSGSGSRVDGTSYTLTCTVTPPTGVQFDSSFPPNVQWLGPDTTILTATGPSQISSGVYISTVSLNPLQETHSGQYSCSATYCLGNITSKVVTDGMNIIVICEYT